jgi:hypothetical protein
MFLDATRDQPGEAALSGRRAKFAIVLIEEWPGTIGQIKRMRESKAVNACVRSAGLLALEASRANGSWSRTAAAGTNALFFENIP